MIDPIAADVVSGFRDKGTEERGATVSVGDSVLALEKRILQANGNF
ncbi:hypothetical protein [Rhizorhapis sp.]|nr:hypothetical protein [Rhizorhapis sp.]